MSISSLKTGTVQTGIASDDVAIIFVVNRRYLPGFRVLIYTMLEQGTLLDLPVIVLTDEQEVFDDPLVRAIADRTRLVSVEEKSNFSSILAEKIQDKHKLDWIAKYTFLKWLIFDDYGCQRLIYIDTDMIVIQPLEPLLSFEPSSDMVACAKFPDDFMDKQAFARNAQGLHAFVGTEHSPSQSSLNSGIMVIGKKLLTGSFRDMLMELASTIAFPSEQRAVWKGLAKGGYSLRYAPLSFNFKTLTLDRLFLSDQLSFLSNITVLHYIGSMKPWENDLAPGLASELWRKFAAEAAHRYPGLLGPD